MIDIPGLNSYFGGKGSSGTYQTIINCIPPHDIYIEPFLGAGSVMRWKKPAPVLNFGMDLDQEVIDCWNNARVPPNFKISAGDALIMLKSLAEGNADLYNYLGLPGTDVFIYLDPPYLMESRKDRHKQYRYEMTRQQHIELLELITKVPLTMVAISCYKNSLYQEYLSSWNCITFESQTRHGKAVEYIYMNYDTPRELHEYNFLGSNFRDRERIKKTVQRHVNRMRRMSETERNAILHAYKNEFRIP
jgi:site-specific DNA-adenine methylase